MNRLLALLCFARVFCAAFAVSHCTDRIFLLPQLPQQTAAKLWSIVTPERQNKIKDLLFYVEKKLLKKKKKKE